MHGKLLLRISAVTTYFKVVARAILFRRIGGLFYQKQNERAISCK